MRRSFSARRCGVRSMAGGALIQLFCGLPAAWGAFQPALQRQYGLSEPQAAAAFAVLVGAFGAAGMPAGALQDRLGAKPVCGLGAAVLGGGFWAASFLPEGRPWAVALVFSLPAGLGCALEYPAVMGCVQRWYPSRRGFATGVVGCAAGLSGAVLSVLVRGLTGRFGLRVCLRVMGCTLTAVCLTGTALLCVPKKPETHKKTRPAGGLKTAWRELRAPGTLLLMAAFALSAPAVLLFSPVILRLGQARGLSENAAALAIVAGSAASAAGRLAAPWASDRLGRRPASMGLLAALTLFSALFAFARREWVVALYACLTFCYSGQAALLPSFAADRFGQERAGQSCGLLTLGAGLGGVLLPLLARGWQGAAPHAAAVCSSAAGFACMAMYGRYGRGTKAGTPAKQG